MKRCCKCKLDKELLCFGKSKGARDGLQALCRACIKCRDRQPVIIVCPQCTRSYTITYNHYKSSYTQTLKRGDTPVCVSCSRINLSARNKTKVGADNPNWKGGITSEADLFYSSTAWKEVRTQAFTRDKYTCVDCGQIGRALEANHIKPRSKFPELKLELTNIETLCKKCHDGKKWMVYSAFD